ncbi:MAG TPA: choice-of-anchor Q domain-containing protein, partial [Thermoleophilaceae bacterium]|nr:choice-of-anchor Q domain-containing protein [Thermoleophilaceae bacterium]
KGDGNSAGDTEGGSGGAAGVGGGLQSLAASNSIARTAVVRNFSGFGGSGGAGGTGGEGGGDTSAGNGRDGGDGGGVFLGGPAQKFENSTIAGNGASGSGNAGATGTGTGTNTPATTAGDGGSGGGVEVGIFAGSVTLTHLTVTGNFQGAGTSAGPTGGVEHSGAANPTVLQNTIVASNSGNQCGGTQTDGGHNLSFPDDGTCAATVHGDPLLGELKDHGGPTPTMPPGPVSPAIDAAGTGAPCAETDQRGVPRPRGPACDIGAVERSLPSAVTLGANSIRPHEASVTGFVNPGGLATTYVFRFGKTAAYGSQTAGASAGAGSATVAALATLRKLSPNTRYHYRLVVTNPDGVVLGFDRTFRTKPLPFPGVAIRTGSTTVSGAGIASLKLACPGPASVLGQCSGRLRLTRTVVRNGKRTTVGLGKAPFTIDAGSTKTVKVKLSDAALEQLRAAGKMTAKATARAVDGRGGTPKFNKRNVTLKAP